MYTKHMINTILCDKKAAWNKTITTLGGHPLQLWGWGEVKAAHNWRVQRITIADDNKTIGAAQILLRNLPKPLNQLCYIPRGPVCKQGREEDILAAIVNYVKHHLPCTVLTIEPDTENLLRAKGWRQSPNNILLSHTLILNLTNTTEELLAAMTKKTRQYIRKSGRVGLSIKPIKTRQDIAACLEIYRQTAKRAKFALHDDQYYYDIHDKLGENSQIFAAYEDNRPVSFLWLATSPETSFELYGGMNDRGQALRANYALKWHAITECKRQGIKRYDMNGLLNDGVSNFKRGFASHENKLAGTYDYPMSPFYPVWRHGLPIAKRAIRSTKKLLGK